MHSTYSKRGIPNHLLRAAGPMPTAHVAGAGQLPTHMGMAPQGMHGNFPMHHVPFGDPAIGGGRPNLPPHLLRQPYHQYNGNYAAHYTNKQTGYYKNKISYNNKNYNKNNNNNNKLNISLVVDNAAKESETATTSESADQIEKSLQAPIKITKDKTPMCLVNEMARANNKGPAHHRQFDVQLKLGDEEYMATGTKIKQTQHQAAALALSETKYTIPFSKKHGDEGSSNRTAQVSTVELNTLAMKMGITPEYSTECADTKSSYKENAGPRRGAGRGGVIAVADTDKSSANQSSYTMIVSLGGHKFEGVGENLQIAKQRAAAAAVIALKNKDFQPQVNGGEIAIDDDVSYISLLHEEVVKRGLPVEFKVVDESGPPHIKTFKMQCRVNQFITEASGSNKKIAKKRAAAKMLKELGNLPSMPEKNQNRRGNMRGGSRNYEQKNNKIEYNQIVEADNPITTLMHMQQLRKEPEPHFHDIGEKILPLSRNKEFIIEARCQGLSAQGVGSSKKVAKRNAAQALLDAIKAKIQSEPVMAKTNYNKRDYSSGGGSYQQDYRQNRPQRYFRQNGRDNPPKDQLVNKKLCSADEPVVQAEMAQSEEAAAKCDDKRHISTNKDPETAQTPSNNTKFNELEYFGRQIGFKINVSDYPKGNHDDFLTIITLSTTPPQICHGVGVTADDSLNDAASNAIQIVRDLGLLKKLYSKSSQQHTN